MSSPSQVAAGFTITGLLDGASRTRGRYPVSEIAVADIADHPANAAYSMDPAGIAELAESIRQDGLTDLPLVRKVGDGSWQMVSGHRRKAAYALLAKDDPAYERMPCRVIEGIDDERAVTLLHAANYFTRALTVTERAAATEALRGDAVRLRSEDPSLSGMRVDDVKAAIIERQTGRKVSGKTIAREEEAASIKGSRYALVKNPEDLTDGQRARLEALKKRAGSRLVRAWELKEDLRAVFRAADGSEAAELLDDWMHRAAYCKIAKVVAVEKKVRRRRDDIIAAVELGISNGRVEAINNKIKVTVRMGYGFRNTDNLVALLMLRCGDCQPQLPGRPVKARKKGVKGAKSVAA